MNALAEYVDDSLGEQRAFVTDSVFQRAILELLSEEEWRDAARTTKEWNEWVHKYKDLQELEERIDKIEQRQKSTDTTISNL